MAPKLIIHPISLMALVRPMAEQVYRMANSVAPTGVANITVWYIEGTKQKIVVDAGFQAETLVKAGRTAGVYHMQTLEQGLGKYGLSPKDIDIVIMTHTHYDHMGYAGAFTKAKFLVQKTEIEYQKNPPPLQLDPRPLDRNLLNTLPWQIVDGDYEVEPGLRVTPTPGHTPGGHSILVDTTDGVVAIDSLCTTFDNWEVPAAMKGWDFIIPMIHNDAMQAYQSMVKLKKIANYIIPNHELRFAWVDKVPPARTRFTDIVKS